jgi:hypothetical protein
MQYGDATSVAYQRLKSLPLKYLAYPNFATLTNKPPFSPALQPHLKNNLHYICAFVLFFFSCPAFQV